MRPLDASSPGVYDRQELVPGFDQGALEAASVALIGAGGIGSEIGEGLVRKGVGRLEAFDPDVVELTNLNRQFFFRRDLYKPKALRLVRNLAAHATRSTRLEGHPLSFEDAIAEGVNVDGDVVVCGIDNDMGRVAVAAHCLSRGIPVLFIAVDLVAENGHVFVQEPGQACFGCAFPRAVTDPKVAPCRSPACKDILKVVAGIALYAIDSLLMDRKRGWNYRNVHLAGFAPSIELVIEKRPDCAICGCAAR